MEIKIAKINKKIKLNENDILTISYQNMPITVIIEHTALNKQTYRIIDY